MKFMHPVKPTSKYEKHDSTDRNNVTHIAYLDPKTNKNLCLLMILG